MLLTFFRIFKGPMFSFLVGKDETPVLTHAAAISATSKQMDTLINNGMKGSQEKTAKLPEIEYNDFVRFCEYAYSGHYSTPRATTPQPETVTDGKERMPEEDLSQSRKRPRFEVTSALRHTSNSSERNNAEIDRSMLPFAERPSSTPWVLEDLCTELIALTEKNPRWKYVRDFQVQNNDSPETDFTEVLLAHARLYAFTTYRLINRLRRMAAYKLIRTVMDLKLQLGKRVDDILELIRYVFNHPGLVTSRSVDNVKHSLVRYVTVETNTIRRHEGFYQLMQEGE